MPDFHFKDDRSAYPQEPFVQGNSNPDKKGFKTIEELELGETNLKYSLRKWVAGALTLCAALILAVFVLHLILPQKWHWLTAQEIESIKSLALTLFGALAMSIATLFYTKK